MSYKSESDGIAEKWTIVVTDAIQVVVGRSLQETKGSDEG